MIIDNFIKFDLSFFLFKPIENDDNEIMSKKSPLNLPNYTDNNELFFKFRQQLRGLTRTSKVVQIVTGVILPIIEGFLVSKATAESSQN